jgi:thiol-disulfide isomerase/thioredoxin
MKPPVSNTRAEPAPSRSGRWGIVPAALLLLFLAACGEHGQASTKVPLVPFPQGDPWLGVRHPLTLDALRGRLVLLDFFTPGCINCVQMLPVLARLEKAHPHTFTVVGIDSPKFTDSGTLPALRVFLMAHHVHEPVMLDRGLRLWNAYGVDAWPTFVLLGPRGRARVAWIGETSYATLARAIDRLRSTALAEHLLHPRPLGLVALSAPKGVLRWPGDVAVGDGLVAVADTAANRILLCGPHGHLRAVVGQGQAGDRDGTAAIARFDHPEGVAFGRAHLYVADTGNNLIRSVSLSTLRVRTLAGNGTLGYYTGGVSGPARSIGLNAPWGLLLRGRTLWIAMAGSHQVFRLDLRTGRIDLWAGTGEEGLRGGPRLDAEFAQPTALAPAPGGGIFVAAPESSSIQELLPSTQRVDVVAGQGLFTWGDRNGPLDRALFQHPEGLASSGGKLFVADTFNGMIRTIDLRTRRVSTLATGLDLPEGMAWLRPGVLLVAETGASRLVTVAVPSGVVRSWPIKPTGPTPPSPSHP